MRWKIPRIILILIGWIGFLVTGIHLQLIEPDPIVRMRIEEAEGWQTLNTYFALLIFIGGILLLVDYFRYKIKTKN